MSFWQRLKIIAIKYDIWLILLAAFFIRIIKLPHAFYGTVSELFRDLIVTHQFLVDGQIPLLGPPASLGEFNFGAIYYYLMAPFVWLFNFNPIGAVFMSTVFSLLSIFMVFKLMELWFGHRQIGLWAAAIMAISLFDVQNSYYISNPNLLPFFILLFLYLMTKVLQGKNNWIISGGLGLAIGIATQLHATALLLLPLVVIVTLIIKRPKLDWKHLGVFLLAAGVIYVPYLYFELTHDFENIRRIFSLGSSNYGLFVKISSLMSYIRFWDSLFFFNNDFFSLLDLNRTLYFVLLPFYCVIFFLIWLWARSRDIISRIPQFDPAGRFIFLSWTVLGSLMLVFYQGNIPPFYYLILWPLPAMAFAVLLHLVWQSKSWMAYYIIALFLVVQIIQLAYFFPIIEKKQFNHDKLKLLFSQVRSEVGDHSYYVINATDHVNLFVYYLRLSGMNKEIQPKADYLFLVYNYDETDFMEPNPLRYQKLSEFGNGDFTIVKYEMVR